MKKLALISVVIVLLSAAAYKLVFSKSGEVEFFSGQVQTKEAYLGSKTGGRIKQILKKEGETVKKGEAILLIEDDEQKESLKLSEAKMFQAQANLQKLTNGYQKEDIAVAKSDIDAKKANFDNAKENLDRIERLSQNNAAAQKDFDDARNGFLSAKAQAEAAQKRLELLAGGFRVEDIRAAKHALQQTEASFALAKLELDETVVRSPMDGRVDDVTVQVGDLSAKAQTLVVVTCADERYVKFYVPETKLHKISVDQTVKIKIDGTDELVDGKVFFIASTAEFTPKNISTKEDRENLLFAVRASIKNDGSRLKNGMIVEVSLPQ